MKYWLVIMAAAFITYCRDADAQQLSNGYPSWYGVSGPTPTDFLPPEYVGTHGERAAIQFQTGSAVSRGKNARLWGTTTSGILAVTMTLSLPVSRHGWDTGFDRVHSLTRIGNKSDEPSRFLVAVWDASASRSRLITISVADDGNVSQTNLGPFSATNELWTAASFVEEAIYFLEAQAGEVRRITDTDADGIVDAVDASFAVTVPQDTSVDKTAFHTNWITGFLRNAQGKIALQTGNEVPAFIEDIGVIPPFIASSVVGPSEFLRLGNGLIVGQKCVFVFGAPSVEFTVKRRDSEGNLEDISKTWTMPEQSWAVVQLTKNLQLDDKVVVVPTTTETAGKSYEWDVKSQNPAIIFEIPLERTADQGTQFRLRGDGFLPSHRVHYKNALGGGILPTTFRGRTKLDVDLPIIGTSTASPPYSKSLLTRIWIEDVSGGVALTAPRLLFIRHD